MAGCLRGGIYAIIGTSDLLDQIQVSWGHSDILAHLVCNPDVSYTTRHAHYTAAKEYDWGISRVLGLR